MPDWIGGDGLSTSERYRSMAERELRGSSPCYETICNGVADDAGLLARLDGLPVPKRQPNLLLAAVRFLGGPVSTWVGFRAFALERWAEVSATMLARRTQTNEPNRCATLLPVLAGLPQPLALLEVGASAGLCLVPDRYGYRFEYEGGRVVQLGSSPSPLRCRVSGPAPVPQQLPQIVWRAGLDLNPLDVRDDEDVRWLDALIWPEQTERFTALRDGVAAVRADPPRIVRGDLATDLPALAEEAPRDATLVVFHSAVLAYVPADDRAVFIDAVRALANRRRVVWLSNEAPGVVAGTDQPPDGTNRFVLARYGVPLARTAPHGTRLEWLPAG